MPISGAHVRRVAVIAFAALRLISYFINLPLLNGLCAVALLFVISQAIPKLEKVTRTVVLGLFALGALFLLLGQASFGVWLEAWLKNASIATMLICVPMLSMPFFYVDYQSELKIVTQTRMRTVFSFCALTAVCAHFLGVLISVGAVVIIYELFSPHAKMYNSEDTFLATLLRSYSSSGFWSPAWTSMALINTQLRVSWLSLIPVGLLFSAIFIGMDLASVFWKIRRHPQNFQRLEATAGATVDQRKLRAMLLLAVSLIGALILGNLLTPWDLLTIIPLVALLFPVAAALLQGHHQAYRQGMSQFYHKSLLSVQNQCALYTAAGFLGKALEAAGAGAVIPRLLPDWLVAYPVLMIGALLLLLILPALAGIHPAVIITVLLSAVTPAALGLDIMSLSLAMLTGCLLGTFLSPLTATSLVLSGLCGRPSWTLGFGLNKVFCLVSVVVFSILIAAIGPLLA
jgi:hypothetical protein